MAHVLPRTVSTDGQGIMQLKQTELQHLFDSNDQGKQRGALSGEESRVGLAVLMIGLWSQNLKQNLAAQGAGDSREAASAVDPTSSPSAAAVSQPSSSLMCAASQSSAKLSHASADSPAASLEQAAAEAASQEAPPLAAGSWADHMSVTASDAEEEEEEATCIPDDVSMVSSISG